jgi:nucleoside-diphosphate-sugar epimerase
VSEPEVHVVVGAAGVTGRRVLHHLLRAGHRVRAVTRDGRSWPVAGTAEPDWVAADAADVEALVRASQGATSVYHCVMPPLRRWRADFPALIDALLGAAARTGARLVYADDTWMYGRVTGPMRESTPWRPVSAAGVLRAWLAERMMHAAATSGFPLGIVRAGELYGPGVRSMIAGNVFGAAQRGRTAHWLGNPDLPITPTLLDDFARTLVAAGTTDESKVAVWHVPHPDPTTGRALVDEASRQAGRRVRLMHHGAAQLRLAGLVVGVAREAADLVYQFEQPFVVDGTRAATAFGLLPTSYGDGVRATLAGAYPA